MHSKLFDGSFGATDPCFVSSLDSTIRTAARLSYTLGKTAAKQVEAC
jgi:hypothetical protein